MRILVVGGTGMIGGHAALALRAEGHDVTIAARRPPVAGTPLAELGLILGDYVAGDLSRPPLAAFDALVFSAGNDMRHLPRGGDHDEHWQRANSDGVPRFFAAARDAGVRHAINIGSFYPQAAPELVERNAYARSRKLADDGVRALATPSFRVMSINPPFVVGSVPGLIVPMFRAYTRYAEGKLAPMPRFASPGGANVISTRSLTDAIIGALDRGESGKAYLVGDENLTFQEYFSLFFRAAGDREPLPVIDQEHPLLPDSSLVFGRGNSVHYEPDPEEAALLGYRRNDVARAVEEVVAQYRTAGERSPAR